MMRIERIQEADLSALAALDQQMQPTDCSIPSMQMALPTVGEGSNHIILGAKIDDKLVGTVLAVVGQMLYGHGKRLMVVEDVVVDEHHRRKGVGAALMGELEKYAAETECRHIMLITDSDRPVARRFYEALGYPSTGYVAFKKSLHAPANPIGT